MINRDQDFDIARNIKAIEWLKTELIINVGEACRALLTARDELVVKSLGNIMLSCYLLARRLGVGYAKLEAAVQARAQAALAEEHELEQWYSDLSNLIGHLESRKSS